MSILPHALKIRRTVNVFINHLHNMNESSSARRPYTSFKRRGQGRARNMKTSAANGLTYDSSIVNDRINPQNNTVQMIDGTTAASTFARKMIPTQTPEQQIFNPASSPPSPKGHPYDFCTEIQAQTMEPILSGEDVLARAKTGTGKTLAFLLPAIQRHLIETNPKHGQPTILVLSPTRELAMQIEKEAYKMFSGVSGNKWRSQVVVGGTNINTETQRLQTGRSDVLVATPGRLLDHLQNRGLASKFQNLSCLVLDEADRLLDQGFRRDLEKIAAFLPSRSDGSRQTLLFSATISPEVKQIAKLYLQPKHRFISTVKDSEESTHNHVTQDYIIADMEYHLAYLPAIVERSIAANPRTKIICFFPTAKATALAAGTLDGLKLPIPCFEIHSRKSQAARTKATDSFTKASSAILLSSDVTARGIDIPGVTAVIQIGMPANGEQYIHRLGRTARAGNEGRGLLILAPWEQRFLLDKEIKDLPLAQIEGDTSQWASNLLDWKEKVDASMENIDEKTRSGAYQAFLGYYASNLRSMGISAPSLILLTNTYAKGVLRWQLNIEGKAGLPPIKKMVVGKMPLPKEALKELNLVARLPYEEENPRKKQQQSSNGRQDSARTDGNAKRPRAL